MAIYYVTVAGAGDNSGDSWANAMAASDFVTAFSGNTGDTFYVAGGSYNLSANLINNSSGTKTSPVICIGVNSGTTNEPPVLADYATGSNRPNITFDATYKLTTQNYHNLLNFQFNGNVSNGNYVMNIGSYCHILNCSGGITGSTGSVFYGGTYSAILSNTFTGVSGQNVMRQGSNAQFIGNIIKTGAIGCLLTGGASFIVGNIFYDLATGMDIFLYNGVRIRNNIFYGATTAGITSSFSTADHEIINNSISDCAIGFKANFSGNKRNTFFDYNNWYNNTMDISLNNGSSEDNSPKGLHDTAVNPLYTTPGSGDFTLQSSSGLTGAGFPLTLGLG